MSDAPPAPAPSKVTYKVIFMGTPDFAVPTLDALVAAGHEVLCVVAQPDKPKGRGNQLQSPPTIERARALGLPTRQPKAVRSGPFPDWMEAAGADVAVVVAYGRILTPRLLRAPRLGCINVHASLLPKYRGAAPIQWSVIHGERETGVATMVMAEGLDTGDVLREARVPIHPDESAGELALRLAPIGAQLLIETLVELATLQPRPQDHAAATLAPILEKEHGRIDWTAPAARIHDRVRGTNPWPGAFTSLRGEVLKVQRSRLVDYFPDLAPAVQAGPGVVLEAGKRVVVAAGERALELVEVQLPGRKVQPAAAALVQGARLQVGERLG